MTITGNTAWRSLGDTTPASLAAEFARGPGPSAPSPLIAVTPAVLRAAGGHSRLMAAMSWHEQKHATWPSVARTADNHNFLSLSASWDARANAHTWQSFTSWAECVNAWRRNLLSTTGPYAKTVTIRDLVNVYAPPKENDVERYIAEIVAVVERMTIAEGSTTVGSIDGVTVPVDIVFGNVDAGPIEWRDIPSDINTAFSILGQRRAMFVVLHRMLGTLVGTDGYFRGEARTRARTDYGVDNTTGRFMRWTDPLGAISPWASGPYQSPSGDAPALVAKLGQAAINRDGISVEIAGLSASPVTAAAWDRIAHVIAFWADWNQIAWNLWPINPRTGLTFMYHHNEFNGAKGPGTLEDCPGPIVRAFTTQLIADVGSILKAAQTRGATASTRPTAPSLPVTAPAVTPVPTALALPDGATLDMVSGFFGRVALEGNASTVFAFDPAGVLSRLWLERGRRTGVYPELVSVETTASGRLFRFGDGWTVLGRPDGTVAELVGAAKG